MAVRFTTFSRAEDIDRDVWNTLAHEASPTMEWEYYRALEKSDSVSIGRGYHPCHLVAYEDDRPVALAPLYERDRSWVEFGDGGLIEFLSELTGYPYHRGLVGTIPFTPVPGYDFLHLPGQDRRRCFEMLLDYIDFMCASRRLSTCRIYFVSMRSNELRDLLSQRGFVGLRGKYCLWFNKGYRSFEDYLGSFQSSRRTKIKRELRSIRNGGIDIRMIQGADASERDFEDVHALYLRTWAKHMGKQIPPFFNAETFRLLGETFRHRVRLSVASRGDDRLAMALFYEKGEDLYGRYWGCFEEVPFLHFATCYYHPIAYAIERGLARMDPGFGGEHKLFRGYEVVPVYHYIKFYGKEERRVAHAFLEKMGTYPVRLE